MRILGWVMLGCLAGGGMWAGEVTTVEVAAPMRRDMTDWIRLPGNTEAEVEVSLFARATGFLRDFKLDVGDRVKTGDVIGMIDAPDLEQDVKMAQGQLEYAKAEVADAEAQLARVKIRSLELDAKEATAKADAAKEKSDLELAQKLSARTQKLFATSSATQQELDIKELTALGHVASVKAAESKVAAIMADRAALAKDVDAAQAAIATAQGKVAVAQATLQRAKVFFDFTKIVAPVFGLGKEATTAYVVKRYVSNGDLITGGALAAKSGQQPLITVVVNDPIRVIADVPETESSTLHVGTTTRIRFSALPDAPPVLGAVARISPALVASTRSLHVEVDVPNPQGVLRAGMMIYMEIAVGRHPGVLAVPNTAVQTNKQGSAVFTVEAGKAKRIPVKTGFVDHDWTEVSGAEFSEHTPVIKDASKGIRDGVPVESVAPAQTAATSEVHN